jgi:hypothetical protein
VASCVALSAYHQQSAQANEEMSTDVARWIGFGETYRQVRVVGNE